MAEHQRPAPVHRRGGVADRAVFAALVAVDQNCAGPVGAQLRPQRPVAHPDTFEFAADMRALRVNPASPGSHTMRAPVAGGLIKMIDFENLAAHGAGAAGFAGDGEHGEFSIGWCEQELLLAAIRKVSDSYRWVIKRWLFERSSQRLQSKI